MTVTTTMTRTREGEWAMRVLVVESEAGMACADEHALRAAGHEVVFCHDPEAAAFPCHGVLDAESCPFEAGVDAAVVVHAGDEPRATAREAGLACALRARVPVLGRVLGHGGADPFVGYVEPVDGDVAAALEAAVSRPSAAHAQAVRDHLLASGAAGGVHPEDVVVTAWRRGKVLRLEVSLPAGAPDQLRAAVSAWSVGAARRYDSALQAIDVVLH
jgi:hypothetical protein